MDDTDAQASGIWPELETLAQPARERRRLPPDVRSRIILQLCARTPLSVKELSVLLDRSEAYIGDAIRPLVTAGELTFLRPDQPRHPRQKYRTKALAAGMGMGMAMGGGAGPGTGTGVTGEHSQLEPEPPASPTFRPKIPSTPPIPSEPSPAAPSSGQQASRFPAQLTNVIAVLAIGLLLARFRFKAWPVVAIIAGIVLALMHVYMNSAQYRQFRELHSNRERREIAFVLLKAGVALVEIVIIYLAASAFRGMP